ncbi:hypothetical protein Ahy_B03g064002 [Arachis hypogaea]|uniref:Replication protein A 70 kDa DNA-binding subunit B/D first OB fold domain-containing protein n=1 Tax=Arachis hypogaea TaxID=3818 RepID=A0A444ZYN6_ARAHY|nr:hypothetical protein Ahy_B03g064002 [Arachis hypogaea]
MAVRVYKITEINLTVDNLYTLVSRFVNLLREEMAYQITYFGVGRNVGNFKTTHHEYVVNFDQRTSMHTLSKSSSIPQYRFSFVSFDTLNTFGFDYTYFVDVFGYLNRIERKKTLEKDHKYIKYNVIKLKFDNG